MKAKVNIDGKWLECQKVEIVRDGNGGVKKILVEVKTGPKAKTVTDSNIREIVLE